MSQNQPQVDVTTHCDPNVLVCLYGATEKLLKSPFQRTVRSQYRLVSVRHLSPDALPMAPLRCIVVFADHTACESLMDQLRQFRMSSPTDGLLFVAECHPQVAIGLRNIVVDEVVWLHRLKSDLLPAIARATDRVGLRRLARDLETSTNLPASLRQSLAGACVRFQPIRSVQELAAIGTCHRRTLTRQWRRAFPNHRLKDFVDWLLLIAAVRAHGTFHRWMPAARAVHINQDTLRRIADRLVDVPLSKLSDADPGGLIAQLRDLLLGDGARDV